MTQQHSKYVAGALLLGLLLPSFAFAQQGRVAGQMRASGTPASAGNFCTRIDTVVEKLNAKAVEHEGKLADRRSERASKIKELQANRDTTRGGHRDTWDANRTQLFAKLDAKATTTEEKAAVATFKTSVDTAVATRRTAVDKAVADYRTAVDKAVTDHTTAVDAAMATFKTARETAVAAAKADCAGGKTPSDVRTTFMASMKAAQDALKASVKALEGKKDTVTPLAEARKADVEKAVATFKTTVEAARTDLKKALKS